MIVPLHNHSMYSALDGFSTPDEIADRVAEIGCPCCGLTDHGVVSGHLEFDTALRAKGIKPIFGCELYHGTKRDGFKPRERDSAHLIALAKNQQGLRNLWSLVDCTSDQGHFHNVGRVFWEDIEKYHEGVIFTSACALGMVAQGVIRDNFEPLNRYLDICGDDFYIEIHTYPIDKPFKDRDWDGDGVLNMKVINEALVAIAWERGIPLVYANDAHYAFPEQFAAHDIYLIAQTGTKKGKEPETIFTPPEQRSQWHPPEALSIMDEARVREALSYLPERAVDEALANSVAIGEMVHAELPSVERHLPVFIPADCPWLDDDSKALSAEDLFILKVEEGIVWRYGENASQEVWDRAIYEADTLLRDGIHHYFLMGWDEMMAAKDLGIETGPGRGSSAGCIVAYALGITDVDPLHYGLIFERFWNSGRAKGFPDIDSDFARARRQEVIQYLKDRWGHDRVQAIGTTGYMKPKSVVDKLYKVFGLSYSDADELKKIIGKTTKIEILGHKQIGWNPELEPGKVYYVKNDVGAEIEQWIGNDDTRRLFIETCEVCCSRVKQYGIHASGIVVSDVALSDELPAYRRGGKDKGVPATMFPMSDVDSRMFVKLDVLGLRTLEALEYWRQYMAEQDVYIEWSGLDMQDHPTEMWDMLGAGFTAGIFQLEDGYGKQLCKRLDPQSVADLSVINALNRPGPIQAGIPDMYIARKNGEEPVTYEHPRLEEILGPILGDTFGLFVYQEQIIAFFNALGYTLSESDAMRKIMGKKQPQELAAVHDGSGEWDGKGYLDMAKTMGIPEDAAESTWKTIEGFADYCFNKSHTVAYAVIGMRAIFAKYYAPAEFYAACMRSYDAADGDTSAKSDRKAKLEMAPQYVNEARRLGVTIEPPHIAKSRAYSWVDTDGTWYFGFEDVLNVGKSGSYICYLRDELGLDISTPEAFDQAFEEYGKAFKEDRKNRKKAGEVIDKSEKTPSQQLNVRKIQALYEVGAWQKLSPDDRSMSQQQKKELEYLGVILTDNSQEVLERNADEISMCDSYAEAVTPWHQKCDDEDLMYLEYKLCGIVSNIEEKRAKKSGKAFGIVTIDSPTGEQIQFTVFDKWKSHKFLFRLRTVGIFTIHQKPANQWGESYTFEQGHKLS